MNRRRRTADGIYIDNILSAVKTTHIGGRLIKYEITLKSVLSLVMTVIYFMLHYKLFKQIKSIYIFRVLELAFVSLTT